MSPSRYSRLRVVPICLNLALDDALVYRAALAAEAAFSTSFSGEMRPMLSSMY